MATTAEILSQIVTVTETLHEFYRQQICERIRLCKTRKRSTEISPNAKVNLAQTDTQIDASRRNFVKPELAWSCDGWPNGIAHRLASSWKSQNVVSFTHVQLTWDQLVSTRAGWPNGEKLASICVRIWARPKSTQVGGQTKRKMNANRKLALTCESVWPGLCTL